MSDLKPCPFCGGEAFLSSALCQTGEVDELNAYARNPRCGSCGADIGYCVSALAATTFWNARPEEDRLKAQNAELLEALENHHKWHLDQDFDQTFKNNDGTTYEMNTALEYSDSSMCEDTMSAISAARESHE